MNAGDDYDYGRRCGLWSNWQVLCNNSPCYRYCRHAGLVHRLFWHVILHKLCIIKINLCIIKCQIVYLLKSLHWEGLKFGQLILGRIVKIVATKCQILRLKCTKIDFGWGSAPDLAGGAYSAPPGPLAGFKGPYF